MREIKFRAWDKKNKWFAEDGMSVDFNGDLWEEATKTHNTPNVEIESCNPENYILEQFTGLKDKNGKEIFDGDIVSVKWDNGKKELGKWVVKFESGAFHVGGSLIDTSNCEVIGNIHQNPELLT